MGVGKIHRQEARLVARLGKERGRRGRVVFDALLSPKVGTRNRPEVKRKVDIVTKAEGGKGAVREFIDLIFKAQGYGDMVE